MVSINRGRNPTIFEIETCRGHSFLKLTADLDYSFLSGLEGIIDDVKSKLAVCEKEALKE